jgi:IclR family KDG regulon transcriptional repressor
MKKREKANYLIQSVSHALDVMEELAKAPVEIGVTQLSKILKLHKNNVFRLLATLELRGYARQNTETEDYALGVKVLQLGQAYLTQSKLVTRAIPILKQLSEATGETVSLAILQNGQVQYPISIESRKPVKVAPRNSVSFPAKGCASGRLLTAQLSDTTLNELLAGNTTQDAAIKSQLNELRSSGQIIDRGAIEADVTCLSRVIRGLNNEVVGAIEVIVPQYRAKPEVVATQLEEAAKNLSDALGSIPVSSLVSSIEKEITSTTSATAAAAALLRAQQQQQQ